MLIERDGLGIPTLTAGSRGDLAFATGYVHAQDRFFQMDLSRRFAAGELSALFGEVAAAHDARARAFAFRALAHRVLTQATPAQRAIVQAYVQGVNAGLADLGSRPFEYWVLRRRPQLWQPEDTILVVYSMWWDLQWGDFERDALMRKIDARLTGPAPASGWKRTSCFLSQPYSSWDAPNGGPAHPDAQAQCCATIPSPAELDVRSGPTHHGRGTQDAAAPVGSNNWALAGSRTASGGALVASDMHLGLRVPAVWYRARLRLAARDLNGLTLPGTPVLVAGSNGYIAWSFSNSYGDWLDVEQRDCANGAGAVRIDRGAAAAQCTFARWLASQPEATNLRLMDFEALRTTEQALDVAPEVGMPQQNLIVGDRDGHIAWTIIGRMPRGAGAARNGAANGWLGAGEQPVILDPPGGQLWAANALATSDAAQQLAIGDDEAPLGAGYDLGARAQQIRDDLTALKNPARPADMLAVQLDDRAMFLTRWHELLLGLLDEEALRGHPQRATLRRVLEQWDGRAGADSGSYWLVRACHERIERAVWQMILDGLAIADAAAPPPRFEPALWSLVTEQPLHMLSARHASWRSFLLSQMDDELASVGQCSDAHCWHGQAVRVRHPLSGALPWLSSWLDMPTEYLPGDHDMPRVQAAAFGASERFAVTPGRESEGYLMIAGGQSGHPLSPYYRAGFADWAAGRPEPFLPGAARHWLTLQPR